MPHPAPDFNPGAAFGAAPPPPLAFGLGLLRFLAGHVCDSEHFRSCRAEARSAPESNHLGLATTAGKFPQTEDPSTSSGRQPPLLATGS